jgi:1,4-dihydroxy-2-naphthoyl-CoA hydrolase
MVPGVWATAMSFEYLRTVRFADTDAAGVVFFANYLALCHEAYEESLAASGIELKGFFESTGVVVPVAKSEAEYLRPLHPGAKLRITVAPQLISETSFAIRFDIFCVGPLEKIAARIRTEHIATSPAKKERAPLPAGLVSWIHSA